MGFDGDNNLKDDGDGDGDDNDLRIFCLRGHLVAVGDQRTCSQFSGYPNQ